MNIILNKSEIIKEILDKYFDGIEQDLSEIGGYIEGTIIIKTNEMCKYCRDNIIHNNINFTGVKIIADGIEQKEHIIHNNSIYAYIDNLLDMYGIDEESKNLVKTNGIYHNILEIIFYKYLTNSNIIDITITPYSEHP